MMKQKLWTVYRHISPSGKSYIGITYRKPEIRWQNGTGYNKNTKIGQAIIKYGWNNIQHEILETDILTLEEAKNKEKYWITYYDSYKNGYNMTEGGDSIGPTQVNRKKVLCYETQQIFESSVKAAEYFNVSYTNIGRACREGIRVKEKHFVYLEDYYNGWEPEKDKRTNKSKRKIVKCEETGEEFISLREASRKTNIAPSLISRCCNGILETVHGLHFYFKK